MYQDLIYGAVQKGKKLAITKGCVRRRQKCALPIS